MSAAHEIRKVLAEAEARKPRSKIAQAYVEGRKLALRECLAIVEREEQHRADIIRAGMGGVDEARRL